MSSSSIIHKPHTKIKMNCLVCLSVLLCAANALASVGDEMPNATEILISSAQLQLKNTGTGREKSKPPVGSDVNIAPTTRKAQGGGKGATGGANIVHHGPPARKGDSFVIKPPCFLSLTVILGLLISENLLWN